MDNKNVGVGILVAIVIAIGSIVYAFHALNVAQAALAAATQAGAGTRFPNGISADATSPTTGQVRGKTLTVTDTATTTVKYVSQTANVGFCMQVNGTSSATTIKYEATTTGPLIGLFGTCP